MARDWYDAESTSFGRLKAFARASRVARENGTQLLPVQRNPARVSTRSNGIGSDLRPNGFLCQSVMLKLDSAQSPAIVLSVSLTGLATVRCLAEAGVRVVAAVRDRSEPAVASRWCHTVDRPAEAEGNAEGIRWLKALGRTLGNRPVVVPCSDADALWLAENKAALRPGLRFSETAFSDMHDIVSKERLYAIASALDLRTVPAITEPTLKQAREWSTHNPGPYLLKPFYNQMAKTNLRSKNLLLPSSEALLDYLERCGSEGTIVQRQMLGGDGHILDCYGLCASHCRPITLASHRRIRQGPANFGTTSYGEIPLRGDEAMESRLFDYTSRLLGGLKYHGIFGIEWLHDRETGELYLIDFNARPFSSIGHLHDCGLNLPLLAYRELCGEDLSHVPIRPTLTHRYWMDALSDAHACKVSGSTSLLAWVRSIAGCRSFAVWNRRDPMPFVGETAKAAGALWHALARRTGSRDGLPAAANVAAVLVRNPPPSTKAAYESQSEAALDGGKASADKFAASTFGS